VFGSTALRAGYSVNWVNSSTIHAGIDSGINAGLQQTVAIAIPG
jgi:hypothetical protein